MIVCYLGPFDPVLTRNRVIIKGLRKNNVELIECNALSSNRVVDYVKILRHLKSNCDIFMLGARGDCYGQPLVPIFKRFTRKPVVFDAMLTLYETDIVDRRIVSEKSLKSKLWHGLDYSAMHNADLILSDTGTHSRYYSEEFNVDLQRFSTVFVGTDDEVFHPRETVKNHEDFLVMFWGSFIPLHGVEYIIKAAKLLESFTDIKFELRGYGQTYNSVLELARSLGTKNIVFNTSWVTHEELPKFIEQADVCLGSFGDTQKAKRVITSKSIDAIAMEKPLITGDSAAAREIFRNMNNCLLVPMADPKALADAILKLKKDDDLRRKIGQNGYKLYKENLAPEAIGRKLKANLLELIS